MTGINAYVRQEQDVTIDEDIDWDALETGASVFEITGIGRCSGCCEWCREETDHECPYGAL